VKVRWPLSRKRPTRLRWRDARIIDLTETALQALMDLRNGPTFVPQSAYGAALASVIRTRQGTSPAEATRAGEAPRASGPLTAM
jgi:hypothetical protein